MSQDTDACVGATARALLVVTCILGACRSAVAQTQAEQLEVWQRIQNTVIYDLDGDRRRLVEEEPRAVMAVFKGILGQWTGQNDTQHELEAAELTPFLFALAVDIAAVTGDERAQQVADEIGISPREFRDRFEMLWRRRSIGELRELVQQRKLAAYGCMGAMLSGYKTKLEKGDTAGAAYAYEVIGPLALLIEIVWKDSRPRERAVPLPEGWKPPDLEPTFVPGSSAMTRANQLFSDAVIAERGDDLLAAVNGYLNSAAIFERLEEPQGQLAGLLRAAEIATKVSDWKLAGRLWPLVEELATELGQERPRLRAAEIRRFLEDLVASGEIEDVRPGWQKDESFGEWRATRSSLKPLGSCRALQPTLDSSPVGWRWVAIGGDSTALLPLPGEPRVSRLGGDLYVDARLDGKASLEIKGDASETSEITLRDPSGDKRSYLVRFFAKQRVSYLGVEFGLGGRDLVFFRTDGAIEGRIGRETIRIVDASGDGEFDTFERDGLQVGKKSKWVSKLSRVLPLGDRLYEIAPDPAGSQIRYRQYEGEVGQVSASCARGEVVACLLRPAASTTVLLDTALGEGDSIPAPVDSYLIDEALIVKGDLKVRVHAGEMAPLEVAAGQSLEIALARDLTLEVGAYTRPPTEAEIEAATAREEDGEKEPADPDAAAVEPPARMLVVPGVGIVVRGSLGETYDGFSPEPLLPVIEIEIDGEVVERREMEKRTDGQDYVEVRIPRDVVRPLAASAGVVRVRAVVDHAILGTLESDWKAVE